MSNQETCIYSILAIIFAFVLSPLGLVFGIMALVKIHKDPNLKGKVLAIIALFIAVWGCFVWFSLLGSLLYYGVLDTDVFIPEKCILGPAGNIECTEPDLTSDGSLLITLKNTGGIDLESATLSIDGKDCSPKDFDFKHNEEQTFNCHVEPGETDQMGKFSMSLLYGKGIKKSMRGDLVATYN